jgi:hypothetical protein
MAARIDKDRAQLLTRTGLDWTEKSPPLSWPSRTAKTAYVYDEFCGIDDTGLPSFSDR